MDPIGTITNYYQFLDEESIKIANSLMKNAPNYISFVNNLVNIVCNDNPAPALRYLGLVHAAIITNKENLIRIRNSFDDDSVVNALAYWRPEILLKKETVAEYIHLIEDALSLEIEDWLVIELLLQAGSLSTAYPDFTKYLDQAKLMIDSNDNLEFYKGLYHLFQGFVRRQEGNIADSEKEFNQGIEISKKYNNLYLEISLLEGLGSTLKDTDTHEALEKLEAAHFLSKELGDIESADGILHSMGLVYTILGEYDLALEAHLEYLRRRKPATGVGASLVLARLYCDLDRGGDAFEWIQWGEPGKGDGWISTMWYLAKALSLIHLSRFEEASSILDLTLERVFKSGSDWTMADYYYVQGNYYFAIDDIQSALESLEKSLGISESMGVQIFTNRCLIALTKSEIAQVRKSKVGGIPDSSGRWMSKLQAHAEKRNYPGIRIQHALLKAEYQSMMNYHDLAKETLEAALDIYDSPSVKSLKKKILEKMTEIEKVVATN